MVGPGGGEQEAVLRAALAVSAALAGGVLGAVATGLQQRAVTPLVHFAAGTFLGVALLHLLPEAAGLSGWPVALAGAVAGWLLCRVLAQRAGSSCPACTHHRHAPSVELSPSLLWIIAVHSILDGLPFAEVAGRAHAAHGGAALLSLAAVLHKLPEGLAVAALCRASGLSLRRTLALTALVECATFLGVGLGLSLGHAPGPWFGLALAGVAGSFLYVVSLTLRPGGAGSSPVRYGFVTAAGAGAALVAHLVLGA